MVDYNNAEPLAGSKRLFTRSCAVPDLTIFWASGFAASRPAAKSSGQENVTGTHREVSQTAASDINQVPVIHDSDRPADNSRIDIP